MRERRAGVTLHVTLAAHGAPVRGKPSEDQGDRSGDGRSAGVGNRDGLRKFAECRRRTSTNAPAVTLTWLVMSLAPHADADWVTVKGCPAIVTTPESNPPELASAETKPFASRAGAGYGHPRRHAARQPRRPRRRDGDASRTARDGERDARRADAECNSTIQLRNGDGNRG